MVYVIYRLILIFPDKELVRVVKHKKQAQNYQSTLPMSVLTYSKRLISNDSSSDSLLISAQKLTCFHQPGLLLLSSSVK